MRKRQGPLRVARRPTTAFLVCVNFSLREILQP